MASPRYLRSGDLPPVTSPPVAGTPAIPDGYWLVGSDGGIFSFGSAAFFGSTGNLTLQRPVMGISPTATARATGWSAPTAASSPSVTPASTARSRAWASPRPAPAAHALAAPIVAMVPSTDDAGYFMVASDGGVFAFGDARFAGSCPGIGGCSGAAVAVMPDATGNGYWLVTATGNVYAFGDAPFLGAPPSRNVAVTSAVRTPDGGGYWVLYADGQLSAFGDAGQYGSPQGALGGDRATAVFATADGAGYWVATAAGACLQLRRRHLRRQHGRGPPERAGHRRLGLVALVPFRPIGPARPSCVSRAGEARSGPSRPAGRAARSTG